MTFKVNLDLEHFWSINERGEPMLELAARNRPDDVKAEFTFTKPELVAAYQEDLADKFRNPELDISDWDDFINWLRSTADALELARKDAFE